MKKADRKNAAGSELLRDFDFGKAVRGRYAGKFNRDSKVTLRDSSGRIIRVTTVGEASSPQLAPSGKPARSALKGRKRSRIQRSRSAD